MSAIDENRLSELQDLLGVRFKDPSLLTRALTHRSAASEHAQQSNERLEFLGDSIVGLVVCEHLFRLFPNHNEGELAKSKAFIVSENSLATAAQEMGLQHFVVMSPGESSSGGRRRRSILSDVFEAVIGAIYLDGGFAESRRCIMTWYATLLQSLSDVSEHKDPKTLLQEFLQSKRLPLPIYSVEAIEGEAHQQTFIVNCKIGGHAEKTTGKGTSRRRAEQDAAQAMLDVLNK